MITLNDLIDEEKFTDSVLYIFSNRSISDKLDYTKIPNVEIVNFELIVANCVVGDKELATYLTLCGAEIIYSITCKKFKDFANNLPKEFLKTYESYYLEKLLLELTEYPRTGKNILFCINRKKYLWIEEEKRWALL